jgi:hypothetical protein
VEINTTLEMEHFGGKLTETRPPGRRQLGNKLSTIWNLLLGVKEGDDDSAVTSGGWQGGGYASGTLANRPAQTEQSVGHKLWRQSK